MYQPDLMCFLFQFQVNFIWELFLAHMPMLTSCKYEGAIFDLGSVLLFIGKKKGGEHFMDRRYSIQQRN